MLLLGGVIATKPLKSAGAAIPQTHKVSMSTLTGTGDPSLQFDTKRTITVT